MYVGKDFDQATPGETDSYTFDFSARLQPGETLTAASWTLLLNGSSASGSLIGSASFTAGGLTTQSIATSSPGTYLATATVTTSAGRTLIFWAHIPCLTPS
jgi:hypothetical protein